MDNAGAESSAYSLDVAAMMQDRIDDRSGSVTGCGVYDETGGLVDDDQVAIVVKHGEGYGLRQGCRLRIGRRRRDRDMITGNDLGIRTNLAPLHGDIPILDQSFNAGS